MSRKRTSIVLGGRTADLITDALEYMIEDLEYRVHQGSDFEDPDDVRRIRSKNDQARRLMRRLMGASK